MIVLLLLSVLVVYWQVGGHGFVNWDDDKCVYANPQVRRGLTFEGVAWSFGTGVDAGFIPLTWISRMADVSLFGLDAGWHHRVNVLLHMVNAVLLFLLLESMTGALWRSGFVAALFALHPLHVESVAWIAERKDVLSTMFWLLATWAYVDYARRGGARRYAAVAGLFALGLMSKPMLATLPFTLLLLDWWPLGRLRAGSVAEGSPGASFGRRLPRLVVEKLPLVGLSAAASVLTSVMVARVGAMAAWERAAVGLRLSNAIVSYASYLWKTVWPASLGAIYPYPAAIPGIPAWKVVLAILLLAGLSCLALRHRERRPWLAAGWLWYLGTLLPVIGIVQVGPQAMADRYAYVPLIGVLLAAAWEAADRSARWSVPKEATGIVAAAALSALAAASWVQAGYWKDGVTLFRRALQVTEGNKIAHNNLGIALAVRGQVGDAIAQYRDAIRLAPDYAEAHSNLGAALADAGRLEEATDHLRAAIRIRPDYADAHSNLGYVLKLRGALDEAVAESSEAVRLDPDRAGARNNLAIALAARGDLDGAIVQYREAIRIRPDYADAYSNLGTALAIRGNLGEAMASYREALRIDPELAVAHNNLGYGLLDLGNFGEAAAHFGEALRVRPNLADARNGLGMALAAQGDLAGAVTQYREALRLRPVFPDAQANLAKALEALGRPARAPVDVSVQGR